MSLGGFKFAGRYCQRGSLTDTQWIFLMHKTKVDAFIASNNLSNAGWSIHMNGSPDGDYHCLDSVGNNYVTCFYNAVADRYFAIYTLCNHTSTGTDTDMVKILLCNHTAFTSSGTRYYIGKYASNFFRLGQVEIAYNTPLDLDCSEDYITRMIPVGNLGMDTSNEGNSGYGKTYTLFNESSVMFGYAIKNDSIVMFSGKYVSGQIRDYLCASFVSGHAFSGLCNNGYDNGTTVLYNTQCTSTTIANTYENTTRLAPVDSLLSPISQTIMFNGTCTNSTGLMCVPLAHFVSQVDNEPFQSLSMFGLENNTTNIWGKGNIDIELLAVNFPGHQQGLCPNIYTTVANGNYLCVRYSGSPNNSQNYGFTFNYGINEITSNTKRVDVAIYVGWDHSNPDITLDASWEECVYPVTVHEAYVSNQGASATEDTLVQWNVTSYLYDASGNYIPSGSTTKTLTGIYQYDGTSVQIPSGCEIKNNPLDYPMLSWFGGYENDFYAYKVTYTEN